MRKELSLLVRGRNCEREAKANRILTRGGLSVLIAITIVLCMLPSISLAMTVNYLERPVFGMTGYSSYELGSFQEHSYREEYFPVQIGVDYTGLPIMGQGIMRLLAQQDSHVTSTEQTLLISGSGEVFASVEASVPGPYMIASMGESKLSLGFTPDTAATYVLNGDSYGFMHGVALIDVFNNTVLAFDSGEGVLIPGHLYNFQANAMADVGIEPNSEARWEVSLSITEQVTVVPVPGSIWLFGSGLMGLAGLRKKFGKE